MREINAAEPCRPTGRHCCSGVAAGTIDSRKGNAMSDAGTAKERGRGRCSLIEKPLIYPPD